MSTDWMRERVPSDIPPLFLQRMAQLLGDEYPEFLEQLDRPAVLGVRANPLKVEPGHLRSLLGLDAAPFPWCLEGFPLPSQWHLGRHPFHAAGLFYLQEPAAMAAVGLLDPRPGERVLDFCAAPGGKATHIAGRMQGQGLLWANEIRLARARMLVRCLERWGVRNAVVSVERPDLLAQRLAGFFDRVLVDAPCSGEARFRRDPGATYAWSPAAVRGCARRQQYILEDAARLVRPGGVLLYATCSFSPEENEEVVGTFLSRHPDFALEEVPLYPGFAPGRPEWAPSLPEPVRVQLSRAVRLWPHRVAGEGHFLARMRRGERHSPVSLPPWRAPIPAGPDRQAFEGFCQDTLDRYPDPAAVRIFGPCLYLLPAGMPEAAGLRFLRPGWMLGEMRRGRFVPGHALAMALESSAARRRLDLPLSDPAVGAYLRGETLPAAGPDGWLLVTVEGYPLGWGRRIGGTVKNYRPKDQRESS